MSAERSTPRQLRTAALIVLALPTVIVGGLCAYWWVTDEQFRKGHS